MNEELARQLEGMNVALAGAAAAAASLGSAMEQACRANLGHEFRKAVEQAFRPCREGNR